MTDNNIVQTGVAGIEDYVSNILVRTFWRQIRVDLRPYDDQKLILITTEF